MKLLTKPHLGYSGTTQDMPEVVYAATAYMTPEGYAVGEISGPKANILVKLLRIFSPRFSRAILASVLADPIH